MVLSIWNLPCNVWIWSSTFLLQSKFSILKIQISQTRIVLSQNGGWCQATPWKAVLSSRSNRSSQQSTTLILTEQCTILICICSNSTRAIYMPRWMAGLAAKHPLGSILGPRRMGIWDGAHISWEFGWASRTLFQTSNKLLQNSKLNGNWGGEHISYLTCSIITKKDFWNIISK